MPFASLRPEQPLTYQLHSSPGPKTQIVARKTKKRVLLVPHRHLQAQHLHSSPHRLQGALILPTRPIKAHPLHLPPMLAIPETSRYLQVKTECHAAVRAIQSTNHLSLRPTQRPLAVLSYLHNLVMHQWEALEALEVQEHRQDKDTDQCLAWLSVQAEEAPL